MTNVFEPREGEFVAVYQRSFRGERLIRHHPVDRVTPTTARVGVTLYRRPKPGPLVDLSRWLERAKREPGAIGPALEPQEKLRAEYEAEQARQVRWSVKRLVINAIEQCEDMDTIRAAARAMGVEL